MLVLEDVWSLSLAEAFGVDGLGAVGWFFVEGVFMKRDDVVNLEQMFKILSYLMDGGSSKDLVPIILSWFKDVKVVDLDWFLSKVGDLADFSGDSDMARRVAGLKSFRERAIRIYEGLERCRVEMDRLRSEALELHRECGCRFGKSAWDGVESSMSFPFCFG